MRDIGLPLWLKWQRIRVPMQETWETWVASLSWEGCPGGGNAAHSRILAWEIPWTEEPGGLQSVGSQRVRHDLVTEHAHTHERCYFWKRKNVCLPELIKLLVFAQESVVCDPWYHHFFGYHFCSSKYSARVMCMTILCLLVFKRIFQHQIQGHLRCKSGLQ